MNELMSIIEYICIFLFCIEWGFSLIWIFGEFKVCRFKNIKMLWVCVGRLVLRFLVDSFVGVL